MGGILVVGGSYMQELAFIIKTSCVNRKIAKIATDMRFFR